VLALAHEGPISGAVVVEALHHGLELLVAHHTVAVEIDLADDLSSMLLAAHDGDQLAGGDASCDTPQERERQREREGQQAEESRQGTGRDLSHRCRSAGRL
jgi:negative regulator of genetic competence, sporulation and motility